MYSCSGSNYQTVCVYVCKHNYFCCKVLTCESMRSDSLLDISGIIGFHQFHKKNKKTPQTFDLNVVGIFFFWSEHFSLQDSKVKPSDIQVKNSSCSKCKFWVPTNRRDHIFYSFYWESLHFSFALQLWTHRPASVPLWAGVVFLSNKLSGASYSLYWDYFLKVSTKVAMAASHSAS